MISRGRGYIPDPAHVHAARPSLPRAMRGTQTIPTISLAPFAPPVFDQGQTSKCTGCSTSVGITISLAAAGTPLPWVPSPTGIYTLGRCVDRAHADTVAPLTDDGAQPSQVMRGISEWGVRPMGPIVDGRFDDSGPDTINTEPFFDEILADARSIVVGEYGIPSGAGAPGLVVDALVARKPSTLAICADGDAIQNYDGRVLSIADLGIGAVLDHYVVCLGVFCVNGRPVFYVRQSWGTTGTWGVDDFKIVAPPGFPAPGHFLVDASVIEAAGDVVALDVTMKPQEAA